MRHDDYPGPSNSDRGPDSLPPLPGEAPLDITRMQTIRLIPPEAAGHIVQQRARRARDHRVQAEMLRQLVSDGMDAFEAQSDAVMHQMREWMWLQNRVRTLQEERRFTALTRELMEHEMALSRQWDALAEMLREASNHEISAQVLSPLSFEQ